MARRPRRTHSPAFKARVAVAAIKCESEGARGPSGAACRCGPTTSLRTPSSSIAVRLFWSEANQQTELVGSCTKTAFPDPDLIDPLPLLFNDHLTLQY